MTIDEALRGVGRLFLDTAPVIYFVESNPAYTSRVTPVFDRIDAATLQAVTSPVTLAECLVQPLAQGQAHVVQAYTDLVAHGPNVTFHHLDEVAASQAADLRARYGLHLPESFQSAVAILTGCDALLTNDVQLKKVQEITVILLDDLQP